MVNRLHAFILLIIYTAFSSAAVASGHLSVENTSEKSEKEVTVNSFPEHRESHPVRISDKINGTDLSVPYDSRHNGVSSSGLWGIKPVLRVLHEVPIYIMHCIFRL